MPIWLVNVLILVCVGVTVFSGIKGEDKLVKTGGWTIIPLIVLGVPYMSGWGGVIFWLGSLFLGFVIAVTRSTIAENK